MNVLRTRGIDHTITCLLTLHRQVQSRFVKMLSLGHPAYQPFQQYQQMYVKQGASTNKQLFGFQLRQIHGCSTAVAMTLMDRYGTTANFMHELHKMGPLRAEVRATLTSNSSSSSIDYCFHHCIHVSALMCISMCTL